MSWPPRPESLGRDALVDELAGAARRGETRFVSGQPGIGKTHFARELAQLLGTGMGFVSMSSLTAGWVLSGASSQWKGARPMLPDGPPVLGPSGAVGVWLNVGHGGSGWALSVGSARLVADAIAARKTPIEIDGLGIERLRR